LLTWRTFTAGGAGGGAARANRTIWRALAERGARVDVLALGDPAGAEGPPGRGTVRGFAGGRIRFARTALAAALGAHYDLCFVTYATLAPLAHLLRRLRPGLPCVVFAPGPAEVQRTLPLHQRLALGRADGVIVASRFAAERLVRLNGVSRERITVVPLCLDPLWIESGTPPGRAGLAAALPAGPMLLTVGRMNADERYKGQDRVIQALPAVLRAVPDAVYVAVGGGTWMPSLAALARELGVQDRVVLLGRADDAALAAYYRRAQVFVGPSSGEAFGLVYLEAMYHGLPVVASRGDGGAEIVRHGETGLLVDPPDTGALAGAIVEVLRDRERGARWGARGREVVLAEHGFARFADTLLASLAAVRRAR
jgi:glycosyltransferase involved in cell wall biosynthesis